MQAGPSTKINLQKMMEHKICDINWDCTRAVTARSKYTTEK